MGLNPPRSLAPRLARVAALGPARHHGGAAPDGPPPPPPPATPYPLTLPGLALWLDSSVVPLAVGTPVPNPPDRSGNGRSVAANPSDPIPTYAPASFGALGAIRCNGQSEYRLGSSIILAGPFAILAVLQRAAGASFFAVNPSDAAPNYAGVCLYGNGQWYGQDDAANVVGGAVGGDPTAPTLARWYRDGSGNWGFAVSGQMPQVAHGAPNPITTSSLIHRQGGSSDGGTSLVGELLIYSAAVVRTARSGLESYLATKWGVGL